MDNSDLFADTLAAAHERGISVSDATPPCDRYFAVEDLRLHFLDWGSSEKLPMVLLHGFGLNAHAWDFFSLVERTNFRICALDFRGHGDSQWARDGDYSRDRYVADTIAFIDALRVPVAVLIGHSLGGGVALLTAKAMSERVRALVLVDSALGPRSGPNEVRRFVEGPDKFPSLKAFADYAATLNPRRTKSGLLRSLRHNVHQLPDGHWTWKYDSVLRSPDRPHLSPDFETMWSALATVPCPILYVRAGEGSHLADYLVPRLESLGPRVRIATVPKAAHSVMGDNPNAFARVVNSFLHDTGILILP